MTLPRRLPPLALVALALVLALPSPAQARWRIRSVKIATGVVLLKIHDTRGPNEIRVLKINPLQAVTVDVGLAGKTWPAYAKTSAIAKAYGAIGAINADFNERGHPLHPFMQDGFVDTSGLVIGNNFGISADERETWIRPARVKSQAYDVESGTTIELSRWNAGPPRRPELAAYTSQGGKAEQPPSGACYSRLSPLETPSWADQRRKIARDYVVVRRVCRRDPVLPGNGREVVLSSRTRRSAAAMWIRGLVVDGTVRLRWGIKDARQVLDTQGGAPVLLKRGDVVAPASCGSYFCGLNPRTGIGYTPEGRVLFVTVDGRQRDSVGMKLPAFARVFSRLGARWALNLDGGGSTTMVARIRGEGLRIVNDPSPSTGERAVPSVMLVLPAGDGDEPSSLASAPLLARAAGDPAIVDIAVGPQRAASAQLAAAMDPGSTGGLLSALAGGAFGFEGELPPPLTRIVSRYRAAGLR